MMLVGVKVAKLSPAATQWFCTPLYCRPLIIQVGTPGTFAALHKSGWGLMPLRSSVVDNLLGLSLPAQK